jgi:NTE family protein
MQLTDFTEDAMVVNIIDDLQTYYSGNRSLIISDTIDRNGLQYVDLVQEGGGILGIALLGYTYVLEAMGIRFLSLGGTSAGAINSLLLAACGKPEEKRTEKLIDLLANKNIGDFMDGDEDARDFIKVLLDRDRSTFRLITEGLQVVDNFKKDLGLNPGIAFHEWLKAALEQFQIHDTHELLDQMKALPEHIHLRSDGDQVPVSRWQELKNSIELAIVAAEVRTETKVIFPAMRDLFYKDIDRVNPADYVRASMSIPLFFKPFELEDIPRGVDIQLRWKRAAKYLGDIPQNAIFVDGGIMSNFPIDSFHKLGKVPRRPTLGVKLGLERRSLNKINNLTNLIAGCFEAARNLRDFEFVEKNQDFKNLVAYIDVGQINWLDFDVEDDVKVELFQRGAQKAKEFLEKFDWEGYKKIRKTISGNVVQRRTLKTFGEKVFEIAQMKEQALKPNDIKILEQRIFSFDRLFDIEALWIDDDPDRVKRERTLLKMLGVNTTLVDSTAGAKSYLEYNDFNVDLIFSDINRGKNNAEGLDFTKWLYHRNPDFNRKVIFYINDIDLSRGTPPFAFGITNNITELVHLVLDVAQRISLKT